MYLPAEIIKQVGEYLTLTEQGSCIRVCYAWYGPFLDLLYTKVHIRSRNQFRLFYSTIQASRQIEDPLGDHVKELTFAYDTGTHKEPHAVGITRDELESFPDLFRHLQVLDFEPKLWKYMRYSDKLSNMKQLKRLPTITKQSLFQPIIDNLASQLTYLSLGGESLGYILNNNLTTSIWTRMPKLERLEIQGNNHVNLNVKMLMALGAQLPRLKHLVLGCVTLPLDEHDMGSTTTFPLFTSAVSLTLKDVHLKNWKMITFLSLAFYHVEVLDFDVTFDWFYNENVTIELYEQSMDACMGFAQLCIFLKKIIFRKISTSVFPFPYDAFFQEIADIHSNNVKVEMTDYAWWSTIDPVSSFKSVTVQTGLLSKANLKWSWTGKKTDISLFRNFKLCKHLTELKLDCDIQLKNGVRLDLLLENVEQLEKLHLSNVLVTTSKHYEKSKKYRLQLLDLNQAILGNHLMDYISQFCTSLQDLWISNSVQEKPRRSAFIVIRMPDHRFKTIKLNSLHLNPGGSRGKSEVPISLLSFYESTRYNRQIERKKETAPEMWRFYHIHKTPHVKKQLRRLSTKEAAVIANFEMNEKKWKIVKNSSARKSFQDEKLWEKDIQFGAILLLCKSVDNFEFNELQL
ncbi:hypothetical protein HPULCUR_010721 [Helicostylum pulchrum]|uniref:F-box domain-containing protein n=1 Tax=Helicostylum pulchrum TaxID=562976 RepID=A0ABP9YG00_9FUNG